MNQVEEWVNNIRKQERLKVLEEVEEKLFELEGNIRGISYSVFKAKDIYDLLRQLEGKK